MSNGCGDSKGKGALLAASHGEAPHILVSRPTRSTACPFSSGGSGAASVLRVTASAT